MNYPDLDFTLSLLLKGPHSQEAAALLRELAYSLGLSLVHRLQIENALLRLLHSGDSTDLIAGREGLRLWRYYFQEQVFMIKSFDLEAALTQATAWNSVCPVQPPSWALLVHPAIAATAQATFLSFDPILRKYAAEEGLGLLPATL